MLTSIHFVMEKFLFILETLETNTVRLSFDELDATNVLYKLKK